MGFFKLLLSARREFSFTVDDDAFENTSDTDNTHVGSVAMSAERAMGLRTRSMCFFGSGSSCFSLPLGTSFS